LGIVPFQPPDSLLFFVDSPPFQVSCFRVGRKGKSLPITLSQIMMGVRIIHSKLPSEVITNFGGYNATIPNYSRILVIAPSKTIKILQQSHIRNFSG
jgi:hypothetical protein